MYQGIPLAVPVSERAHARSCWQHSMLPGELDSALAGPKIVERQHQQVE
jgi:hypothetical protein